MSSTGEADFVEFMKAQQAAPSTETPQATPEPAATETADQTPKEPEATAPAVQKPPVNEPFPGYSALPEEARKHFDKLRGERDSAIGKVAPTQRKLSEAEQRIKQADQALAQLKRQPASAQRTQSIAEWEDYKREWGAEATAIEKLLASRIGPIAEELREFRSWRQQQRDEMGRFQSFLERDEATRAARTILAGEPDAAAIMYGLDFDDPRAKDPDFIRSLQEMDDEQLIAAGWSDKHGYHKWANENVPHALLEGIYERNDPTELAWLIRQFKASNQTADKQNGAVTPDPRAAAVEAERQKQRSQAAAPPRSQTAVASPASTQNTAESQYAAVARMVNASGGRR